MNRGDCREAIFRDGLDQLGWARAELERRTKGDRAKIRIARRRCTETVFTLKWIAAQLPMATWTQVAHRLQQMKDKSQAQSHNELHPG